LNKEGGDTMEKPLILKVSCNYPEFLMAIRKQNTYLNALYQKFRVPFYLEAVEGGFLLVVENLEAFKRARDEAELGRKMEELKTKSYPFAPAFLDLIRQIAAKGDSIVFTVECQSSESETIFAILKDNFNQVSPEITVIPIDFDKIKIEFGNLETFKSYCQICMSFTHDLGEALPKS
jgi:hypothetical protein